MSNSAICQEIEIHFRVSAHSKILKLIQTIEIPEIMFLIFPYIPHGTLADQDFGYQCFVDRLDLINSTFRQLVSAISFCHANGIPHCDLKPQNILCGYDQIHVPDFGLASDQTYSKQFF